MKYNKPELHQMGSALGTIQSGVQKIASSRDNAAPHPFNASATAYEADE